MSAPCPGLRFRKGRAFPDGMFQRWDICVSEGATHPTAWVGERVFGTPGPERFRRQTLVAMAGQKIRIRLKAYDHEVIDSSAKES
ncbi:hypothetical protein SALBM311S_06460 [Streptomyces alboniger]